MALQAQHTNGVAGDTAKPAPMTEAENLDAIRRYRYVNMNVECELTTLEGLCVVLREMRFSGAVNTHPPKSRDVHGLFTIIDCVLYQAAKLSAAYRGEGYDDDDDEGADEAADAAAEAYDRHEAAMREAAEERRRVKEAEDAAIKMAAILPNMDVARMGADFRRGMIGPFQALLNDIAGAEQAERARCERAEAAASKGAPRCP